MRTPERVQQMNDVISGIAKRSAYKFLTKSSEELAQELWLHILEKEDERGDELDLDLVAKMCYDKIVDIQRFDARRNSISYDQLFEMPEHSLQNGNTQQRWEDEADLIRFGAFVQPDNLKKIMVDDLFKIFPEGSKERLFLEYWGTASGVKDFGIRGDGKYEDGYTESDLAHKLGYSGTSSGGYKSFRKKMRIFVLGYFED